MEQQVGPSAACSGPTGLFDLPMSCLQHIVSFMDGQTKHQFFRTSKGSHNDPGCAVVMLRASRVRCTYNVDLHVNPRPAFCSLLHWAAHIDTGMQLAIRVKYIHPTHFQLIEVLDSLLLHPDARDTPSRRALNKPATYPGITRLHLVLHQSVCLIPGVVADAFPNLKTFIATWVPDTSQPLGPALRQRLASVQHVTAEVYGYASAKLQRAAFRHIAQQLGHMPSLTSISANNDQLQLVPVSVLAKLKNLNLQVNDKPLAKDKAALKACSQLERLVLHSGPAIDWVQALPLHIPSIRALHMSGDLGDAHMSSLLDLPHLTSLTVGSLSCSGDFSSAPCGWKHLTFTGCCNSITRLPLHTLDSPVKCSVFELMLSDHAADLAAIRAAKPHLLKCGGIKVDCMLRIHVKHDSPITKEQAAEVLAEWAPCLSVPQRISCYCSLKPMLEDAAARLWPAARFDWYGEPHQRRR